MERSNLQELLEREDYAFLFKGSFDRGIATGAWTFEFGEFQSQSQSKVVDYQYRVLVSGLQKSAKGTLSNGKPEGLWRIQEERIVDSDKTGNRFESEIGFRNGIPEQSFKISDSTGTLVGRFLRDGLAHDRWDYFPKNSGFDAERWIFNEAS